MRFDPKSTDWPGHVKRREGLGRRLRTGDHAAMWGAMAGNLAWEMLRIVGRRGRVWAQEPSAYWGRMARDFFILPNLTWCDRPSVEMPAWSHVQVCVIDWVPHGGDLLVLDRMRDWPALSGVRNIMTEQRDPIMEAWMREHGFQHAPDSERRHEWWDRE